MPCFLSNQETAIISLYGTKGFFFVFFFVVYSWFLLNIWQSVWLYTNTKFNAAVILKYGHGDWKW